MSDDSTLIAAATASFDRALIANDAARVAEHFTATGVFGESGIADLVGPAAIRDFLHAANQKRQLSHHKLIRDELILLGDRAIEFARFEETKLWPGKPPIHEWGRVVLDWRRQNGRWLVERLIVSDLPEPGT